MPVTSAPAGRRERNKQEKLDRIVAAAGELFAEYGVDDVTTQQIADKADIGTGTLFLYAKTKGELLLLVQNTHYVEALAIAAQTEEAVAAVLRRDNRVRADEAAMLARVVSAIMFISMAATLNAGLSVDDLVQDIRNQLRIVLHSPTAGQTT